MAPNRERGENCLAWLPWRRRACPSATLDKQSVFSCSEDYSTSRSALPVHDFGRELGGFGQVDIVGWHRLLLCEPFEIRQFEPHAVDAHAPIVVACAG